MANFAWTITSYVVSYTVAAVAMALVLSWEIGKWVTHFWIHLIEEDERHVT